VVPQFRCPSPDFLKRITPLSADLAARGRTRTLALQKLHRICLTSAVPEEADALIRQAYTLLPHVKITDLLLEVDRWTSFTDDFTHLKKPEPAKDRALLLTVILADAINLELNKMAEACPGTSIAKLSWLSAWHIRDETYSKALATLVNHQHRQTFASHWGEGTTFSSDGQRFQAGAYPALADLSAVR
jgi:Tn3 transposase DDE domain